MRPQYDNRITSSLLLYVDNLLLTKGESYSNVTTRFYPNDSLFGGYYAYASPYKQIIADASITGATIMTGVYLGGTFIGTGQSGFAAIDYYNGQLYFTTPVPTSVPISGTYSTKEFNVVLTDEPEDYLLFETKYSQKPRVTQTISGLQNDSLPYPIIFIKNNSSNNEPFAFGGTDETRSFFRLVVMADSQFAIDAVNSIVRDQTRSYVPIFNDNEFPFNALGHTTGYNYTGITNNKVLNDSAAYIDDTFSAKFNASHYSQQFREINPYVYTSIIDIELTKIREPRLA